MGGRADAFRKDLFHRGEGALLRGATRPIGHGTKLWMQGIQLLAHGTQLDRALFGFGGKNSRLTGKPVASVLAAFMQPSLRQ